MRKPPPRGVVVGARGDAHDRKRVFAMIGAAYRANGRIGLIKAVGISPLGFA